MPAPTWPANGNLTTVASGTTRTPVLAAHAADSILVVQALYNGAADLTIDAGWTPILVENNAGISTGLWWRRATSSAETNPTVTASVAATATAALAAQAFTFNGCATTGTPFEAVTGAGPTTGTTVTGAAITTLGADRKVVTFVSVDDDVGSSGYPPSGWTDENDITSATGGGVHLIAVSKVQATAGSVAAASFGIASATWKSVTLAFRDSVPVTGPQTEIGGPSPMDVHAEVAPGFALGIETGGPSAMTVKVAVEAATPIVILQPRASWTWELVGFDGERLAEIQPRGRRVVLELDAAGSAVFSFDAIEVLPYVDILVLGEIDLLVSRASRRVFRGPVGGAQGANLTGSGGEISFAATGILELLGDRYTPPGLEIAATEQTTMAWQLIAGTQGLPAGDLGIAAGALPASVARTKTWDSPTPVLSAIREIAGLEDGFNFSVEPDEDGDYRFDTYFPRRGFASGVVLEAGRNVARVGSVTWDAGPGALCNVATAYGASGVSVEASDATSMVRYRRRERVLTSSEVDDAVLLGDRANAELRDAYVRPRGNLELQPGSEDANLDAIGLGDVVEVDVVAGWARFQGPYRVTGITVELPDGGGDESLTVAVVPFDG